jgi:hypothetical protein
VEKTEDGSGTTKSADTTVKPEDVKKGVEGAKQLLKGIYAGGGKAA